MSGRVRELRRSIDVERLLWWVYRDQKADIVIGRGDGMMATEAAVDGVVIRGVSGDGVAAVISQAQLGCRVDGGGASADHLHRDAETAHRAVMRLPRPIALTVMQHARAGTRPDWLPEARPKAEPRMTPRGKVLVRYDVSDVHRNYGWCVIDWTTSVAQIQAARTEWALWHAALWSLSAELSRPRVMTRFLPSPPSVPAEPWLAEQIAA